MLLTPDPIVAQFLLMKFGRVQNQSKGAARQLAVDEFHGFDTDFRFIVAVNCVEVWRRVIVIIHSDDDSEKDAQFWHVKRRFGATLQNPATGHPRETAPNPATSMDASRAGTNIALTLHKPLDHFPRHIRQSEMPPLKFKSQPLVIDSQTPQYRRLHIVYRHRI
jgi:hypothetical protein